MSVQLQAFQKPLERVVPRAFFESALPTALGAFLSRGIAVSATFDFHIRGSTGGAWRIDGPQGTVRPCLENEPQADCVLEMGLAEFEQMTSRPQETSAALREGRIVIRGNPEHLAKLAHLLAP
ncbi:MAG: SCP2 sterol-binding domain-containing protein [Myxococcota bacterium]